MGKNITLLNKGLAFAALSIASSAFAQPQPITGQVEVTYNQLYPAYLEGALCDNNDQACQDFAKTCQEWYGELVGSTGEISYSINPATLIHNAQLNYNNITVKFSTMGISGKYYFISSGLPNELRQQYGIRSVFFLVDGSVKNYSSHFLFNLKTPDQKYQCVLSGAGTL